MDLLASILEDPDKAGEIQPERVPELLARVAALLAALAGRALMLNQPDSRRPGDDSSDIGLPRRPDKLCVKNHLRR